MKKLILSLLILTSFASIEAQNVQTLSGATTITCAQDNTLTLTSSETGFNYFLRNDADNSIIGSPQAGTGSALSFQTGSISETRSYHVYALRPSYALDFDGHDERIAIPHSASLQPTTGFTIDCWVNSTDITNGKYSEIFRKDNGGVGRILLGFQEWGTILSFGIDTDIDGYQELDISIVPSEYTNQWVHILAYYDDVTNTAKVFRDGVEIGSVSRNGVLTTTLTPSSAYICGTEYYDGKIASFRLWDKALTTSSEREYAQNNILTNNESGLVAYYPFYENTGTILNDVTANANNGNFEGLGGPAWTTGTTGAQAGIVSNTQTITFSIASEDSQDGGYLRSAIINKLPTTPSTSSAVNSVAAADFDNDGDMDMAYIIAEDGDLGWFENDGAQSYTQNNLLTGDGQAADKITADDLDLDGDIDIILGGQNTAGTHLRWLKNDGTGNFTLHTITSTIGDSFWDITDLDKDGDMDILSVQNSAGAGNGKTVWYENDGSLNFTEHLISTSAAHPTMVRAVDIDHDGDMDAVVSSNLDNKVIWFENNGSQSFTANSISTTDTGANSVAVADIDCDGDIDVFTASDNAVTWYKNNGSEVFSTVVIGTDAYVDNIRLKDLDNDGDLDILTSFEGVKWFENDNNTSFTKRVLLCCAFGSGGILNPIDIADRDNDGDLDVLTAAKGYNTSVWVKGLIWIEIDAMITSTSPAMNEQNIAVSSDITLNFNQTIDATTLNTNNIVVYGDRSGKIDGAFSGGGTSTIVFNPTTDFFNGEVIHVNITSNVENSLDNDLLGQHAFDFRVAGAPYGFTPSAYAKHLISDTTNMSRASFPADMDSDGDMDVVIHEGTTLGWFENDGSQNYTQHDIATSIVDNIKLVYAIDLDLDGDMDALSISQDNSAPRWFENDGSQNFTEHMLPAVAAKYELIGLQPADFDGDGDIDIYISFADKGLVWYENDGSQNFTIQLREEIAAFYGHAADMDMDGDLDIVTNVTGAGASLVWYENDGYLSGTLHTISSASGLSSNYAVDLDGDGDMDVVAGSSSGLVWFENDGTQNFTEHSIESIGGYGWANIDAMDMDGDLDIDLVVGSGTSVDYFCWFTNDGSQNFTKNVIDELGRNFSAYAVDMDNDGDMDVLTSFQTASELAWYEFGECSVDIVAAAVVCSGEDYTFPDGSVQTITAQTIQTSTLQTINSCDSIIVTTVDVNPVYNETASATVCSGEDYTFPDGSVQTITAQTIQTSTLQSINLCDSIIVTTVNIIPSYNETATATVCSGSSYIFPDGSVQNDITAQVVQTSTLQSVNSCDSIIITTVNVFPTYNETASATVCPSENYTFPDGSVQAITAQVVQTSTLQSINSCDSIIVTTVDVNPVYNETASATVCSGEDYTFPDGSVQTITAQTIQTSTLQSVNSCDSIIVTTVDVNPVYNETASATVCSGEDYTFPDGSVQTITAQTIQTSTLQLINLCDSIIVTTVDVNPVYNETASATVCSGEDYTFPDGSVQAITAQTIQTSTLQSINSCDSIIVTTVDVNSVYNETAAATVCPGEDYTFPDGSVQTITAQTIQTSTLQSVHSCDSIIVTTVDVNPVYNETASATVCSGEDYTFPDGSVQTITAQTIQTSTLQSVHSCDSIIVTTVDVNPVYNETAAATVCSGEDYTFPDGSVQTITAQTIQTSTLQTINSCDSIIATTVDVNPVYNETAAATVCSGEDYTFPDGSVQTITAQTIQTSTLQSINSCDSIIVTTVDVNPVYNETAAATVCPGEDYTFPDGSIQTITAQTIQTSTLQSVNLCDSIIATTVDVNPVCNETAAATVCSGEDYTFPDGSVQTITAQVVQTSTLQSVNSCDSIIVTTVDVNPVYNETAAATVCSGEDYTFPDGSAQTITAQVVQTSTLQSVNSCDSIIVTTVDVNPVYNETASATVCLGENYTFPDGSVQTITAQVVQTSTLQLVHSCDSIIVTTVDVNPVYNETASATVCSGEDYTFPDGSIQTITAQTIQTSTLQSVNLCDSIIATTVDVNPVYNETAAATVCSGEDYTFPDGSVQTITAQTIQTSTLQSINSCDSIIVTTVDIIPSYNETATANVCSGSSYIFPDGSVQNDITAQVVQTSTLQSVNSCDSIIVTTVNVNPSYEQTATVCSDEIYTFPDGSVQTITAQVVQTSTLPSLNSCDSVIVTTVNVFPIYNEMVNATVCFGGDYVFPDGSIQTIIGQTIQTSTLQSVNSCDSVIVTTVDVTVIDTSITNTSPTLSANQTGASYQWLDCDNGYAVIQGATYQNYTATASGNYAVEITTGSCVDTSSCQAVIVVGIDENDIFSDINIYPNPSHGLITVNLSGIENVEKLTVSDNGGRLIYLSRNITESKFQIDLSHVTHGIYFLRVESDSKMKVFKVIRN